MSYLISEKEILPNSFKDNLSQKSDEEVLSLSVNYPKAFEVLIGRYQEAFIRKLRTITRSDSEEIEDIVQETFVKIYLNANRFKKVAGASFKSWGYKILINTCFTQLKKSNRQKEMTAELEPEIMEIVSAHDGDYGKRLDLDEFLRTASRLPQAMHKILTDIGIHGKTYEDVARDEGVSVSAVRTRLHRAKKAFEKLNIKMI